ETVVPHAGGWSLDRLVAVRDQTWFAVEPSHSAAKRWGSEVKPSGVCPVSMHRYLRQLAHSHVESQTGTAELYRAWHAHEFNTVTHSHWLCFSLPDDLVLSAVDIAPPPMRIGIENILLMRALIDRQVAEIHHHVGAGMDFRLLWAGALAALASPDLLPDAM